MKAALLCLLLVADPALAQQELSPLGNSFPPAVPGNFFVYRDIRCAALFAAFDELGFDVTLDLPQAPTSQEAMDFFTQRYAKKLQAGELENQKKLVIRVQPGKPAIPDLVMKLKGIYKDLIVDGLPRTGTPLSSVAGTDLIFCRKMIVDNPP